MREALKHYINGRWVDPVEPRSADVINPATEEPVGRVALGSAADVDRAAAAARRAFAGYARSTRQERMELLEAVIAAYKARRADVAAAITAEMGAPAELADKLPWRDRADPPAHRAQRAQGLPVLDHPWRDADRA